MLVLRSLLSVLLLALAMAPPLVLAGDDAAAIGEQRLAVFEAACPVSMTAGLIRSDDFKRMDERDQAVMTGIAGPACACAITRLREYPSADIPQVMESDAFRKIAQGCIADYMKVNFGAYCRVLYRRALPSHGAPEADRACNCAQVRVDTTSNEQFVRLLGGENGGVDRIVNDCMRNATTARPRAPGS